MSDISQGSRCLVGILVAAVLTGSVAFAQGTSTASIAGVVRDASGGVLPGVTVTATQTDTGFARTGTTDEEGRYNIPLLPIGPYRLEFSLQGFTTYAQTGIVLEVNAAPTINASLSLGNLEETVLVEGASPLIETRSVGIGMVVDNQRVLELPLNGRQTLDLVFMTGMAVSGGTLGGARGGATSTSPGTIAVAGGLPNATAYSLDGATHTDPFNGSSLPLPFPEALQEFKVETSALPAQYGHHSAAAVNAVTKSGTNTVSGSVFEFVRDDALNATDPFAPLGPDGERRSDGLNRNQFGGSVGGPLVRDRLFYFLAYQRTRIRRVPASSFQFVPTQAMLNGDFTAIASAACNTTGAINLRAPFVGNKISPTRFSPASLALLGYLPKTDDPCGQVFFDRIDDSDEDVFTTKVDYNVNNKQSVFGRLLISDYFSPSDYDGQTLLSPSRAASMDGAYSGVFGHQYLISNTTVNGFRVTVNKGPHTKEYVPLIDYNDIGVKATPVLPEYLRLSVSGGFSLSPGLPTATPTLVYQVSDDMSILRGNHQLGLGANYIYSKYDPESYTSAAGNTSFNGSVTGLGLADFMIGRANQFVVGTPTGAKMRSNYIGLYVQDSWTVAPNVTLNLGLRWDPYFPAYSGPGQITHFDRARFDAGLKSSVFNNAPAGLIFTGDEGMPGKSVARRDLWNFAPRLGVVWDPRGDGRQTLRVAYGRLYDLPHLQTYTGLAQMSPWGNAITQNQLPSGWDDPWAATPGGDPIPALLNGPSPDSVFPFGGNYTTYPLDLQATAVDQWNVSFQRQLSTDWMVSANYIGSMTKHIWGTDQINPAVYTPGSSTTGNTQARRVLQLQNPDQGRYFASIQELDDDASMNYNGVLLSVQKRQSNGFSLQGNYAISRCITDRWNSEPGVAGVPYMIPGNREADRGRCPNSPEHNVNVSAVYQIPGSGGDSAMSVLSRDWQVSGIVAVRSGTYLSVTTGADTALTGQQNNQRANQILDDPYVADRTLTDWLNPKAFEAPATGTYGAMPLDAFLGPGRWNVDMSLSKSFRFGLRQFQFRWEIFNVFNTMTPNNPVTTLNSSDFGKVTSLAAGTAPRIMQLGFKFNF
jgi:carboxypeptidase family protein/TonB-dependent receptor-like protein